MATVILQVAGAYLGGFLGSVGAAVGTAAGAVAGYALDRALIQSTQHFEGPRLSGARLLSAEEGVSLPRVYGTARLGGSLIWGTRFEEDSTESQGGKGGATTTSYSYFANAALALCEGRIAGIRRVWADGRELDLQTVEMRFYRGDEEQLPDPLVEAKQGAGNAPAYRGTAYVVFERFPIGDYGNRLPQFQFEVMRPVGDLHERIRAVALIPGSTEYGLSPSLVTLTDSPGETRPVNRNVLHAATDLMASLDELQALCPNLQHVAVVVSWFGDDLRAGECLIRPAVTQSNPDGLSDAWIVSGVHRADAATVSEHGGGPAYGGTPSDRSVMDAIAEIRARGLGVTLYPFVMMDVPGGNGLPDPYGGTEQGAYPWRGRITCHPAAGVEDSVDATATAASQIAAFCGTADAGDFDADDDTIDFDGDPGDWGYRRFILHYAHLAEAAGGVDAFLLGSELRGLTQVRGAGNSFPFVAALADLAEDVRGIVGPATKLTYGADWSEYSGYRPQDDSGDHFFHLDALWAHPDIDAVGIDNYMPLADWRDEDYAGDSPDGFAGPHDRQALRGQIAAGEGFDWYYASGEARLARNRSAISDGAYGKPWTFRNKDLVSWWSNEHVDRVGGVEAGAPTAWVPQSKPFWFTELGCSATDKGPNQPNVFRDAKSSEDAIPYFSNGGRSDVAMRRFLGAHLDRWDSLAGDFDGNENPTSPLYDGRMVEAGRLYVWAWDARPFPAFPAASDVWSDGLNWLGGHWLNGRLSGAEIGDVVNAVLTDNGLPQAQVAHADGSVTGYLISDPVTARAALEPIVQAFGLGVRDDAGSLSFMAEGRSGRPVVEIAETVLGGREPAVERGRTPDHALPTGTAMSFRDGFQSYQSMSVRMAHPAFAERREEGLDFPGILERGNAEALASDRLQRLWQGRETISFALPPAEPELLPGDIIRLPHLAGEAEFLATEIEEGLVRRVSARRIVRRGPTPWQTQALPSISARPVVAGPPWVVFLDLPMLSGSTAPEEQFRIAARSRPWRTLLVFASPEESGFVQRATVAQRATMGTLGGDLPPGFEGRLDHAGQIVVDLPGGALSSVSLTQLLAGSNVAAIRAANGQWEIVQFSTAEEIEPKRWRLTGLLRGQAGTSDAMAAGAGTGAEFVILDGTVVPAGITSAEAGIVLNWRVGPAGHDFSDATYGASAQTGGVRARLPLSPVHMRATVSGGDATLAWIRRGRIDADSWTAEDIPIGEESEAYRVDVVEGGIVLRSETVTSPAWTYPAAAIAADFGTTPAFVDIDVRQLSATAGAGLPARISIPL